MTVKRVQEPNIGVYVALDGIGIPIDDDEGHILCIDSMRNDQRRIRILLETAKSMGYEETTFHFLPGERKVTDFEYAMQVERHEQGLIADPYDIGNLIDERRKLNNK